MTFIQTYSGAKFDFSAPDASAVNIADIAHSLSQTCRFGGHTERFYSVADHCVNACDLLARDGHNRDTVAWGLLHDASEAYVGDIVTPFKRMLPAAEAYEERLQIIIRDCFGIDSHQVDFAAVKQADETLLVTEALALFPRGPLENWTDAIDAAPLTEGLHVSASPREAERRFMERFYRLRIVE
jgi:5'-deoxynucleotidase YfbR-like HD superfamily hydrolase